MPYLSSLIGRPVVDSEGCRVGSLKDIVAHASSESPHPKLVALEVKRRKDHLLVPYTYMAALVAPAIPLTCSLSEITPYELGEHDLFLVRDVLDKQIIDTSGVRVVRVNDLEIMRADGHFYVANVDISGLGLLRRLGLAQPALWLTRRLRRELRPAAIPWDSIELLPGDQPMRLRVPSDKIADLHPADLAEIISDLGRAESSRLLESLDIETVADTLQEIEPEFQVSLVESMPDERVADVLEEMEPDEAADLLAELPEERSQEILELMERDEAEDVRRLLAYPEDTAGGIMTTEFATISADLTVEQAIATLRKTAQEVERLFYVYVTDAKNRLVGVLALQDLVLAPPQTPVSKLMRRHVISVDLNASQNTVAQIVAKYNLLAVPVLDDQKRLQGVVTVDDALDKIIPTRWKKRLPRLYR